MIDANKVGNVISLCRKEKGLTQDELAARLGVTAQAVSKWERGGSLPDTSILPDIARILALSIDEMLAGVAPSGVAKAPQNPSSIIELLQVDEIRIQVAVNLCMGEEGKAFIDRVVNFASAKRKGLAHDFGVVMPIVRFQDNTHLADNEYVISIHGVERRRGTASVDKPELLLEAFVDTIDENLAEFVTRQMVKSVVENLSERHSALVSEMFPGRLSFGRLREILAAIVREGVSIRRLACILEETDKLLDSGMSNEEIGREIAKKQK